MQAKLVFAKRTEPDTITAEPLNMEDKNTVWDVSVTFAKSDLLILAHSALFDEEGELVDFGVKAKYDPPELGEFTSVIHYLNEIGLTVDDMPSLLLGALAALQDMLANHRFLATRKLFVSKEDRSYYG